MIKLKVSYEKPDELTKLIELLGGNAALYEVAASRRKVQAGIYRPYRPERC